MSSPMLENVKIAKPCAADWNAMTGDERVRFCQACKLHVYNLSDMTRAQAEDLLTRTEGNVCVRLYKRADGTVITKDCPVGLAALRRRVATLAASVAALLAVGCSSFFRTSDELDGAPVEPVTATSTKTIEPRTVKPVTPVTPIEPALIEPTKPRPLMGAPMPIHVEQDPPVKDPEPQEPNTRMGKVQRR